MVLCISIRNSSRLRTSIDCTRCTLMAATRLPIPIVSILISFSFHELRAMALVDPGSAGRVAWTQSRDGMVIRSGVRVATTFARGSLPSLGPDCSWPRIGDWTRGIRPLRAWHRGTGQPVATRWRCDSSWAGWMEIVAHAASDLGWNACRLLGSNQLVLDHGERTWCWRDADTAPARCNVRRNVERQNSIIVCQLAVRAWRCSRSYHLASRRGRNYRLAGL